MAQRTKPGLKVGDKYEHKGGPGYLRHPDGTVVTVRNGDVNLDKDGEYVFIDAKGKETKFSVAPVSIEKTETPSE